MGHGEVQKKKNNIGKESDRTQTTPQTQANQSHQTSQSTNSARTQETKNIMEEGKGSAGIRTTTIFASSGLIFCILQNSQTPPYRIRQALTSRPTNVQRKKKKRRKQPAGSQTKKNLGYSVPDPQKNPRTLPSGLRAPTRAASPEALRTRVSLGSVESRPACDILRCWGPAPGFLSFCLAARIRAPKVKGEDCD
ncbi:hypothetical protein BS50DRAFT_52925 [Corynespora cassiicola Philippines]|uniref:Uncharacterized protein n=1 Tax=Corynespora cassiicola Philippines TaxID=1448308 RepID=A0A2T2NIC0_CORCC|nr:hypothetical protein BS50DRAFT_52925 [Corynespora cassiicola Philippines]